MEDIRLRGIRGEEITPALFSSFERYQEVRRCWRKEGGRWTLRDIAFTERWNRADYEELVRCLTCTVETGGAVFGAFSGERLIGFASVEGRLLGPQAQYAQLSCLHVSNESRGEGLGRRLFSRAVREAVRLGAQKLYISAHSSEESQAFYRAMGCVEAVHYDKELHEKEPCDCQLECALHPWVRRAGRVDADTVADLALRLWPAHERQALCEEMAECMAQGAVFLAFEEESPIGFAQCSLRSDYVEGTDTSPVGYLEGIFVTEDLRGRGIARGLLEACERWARDRGCVEFASDCELGNEESRSFHLRAGFAEANRIVCFVKKL